jgi:hypothetical protein
MAFKLLTTTRKEPAKHGPIVTRWKNAALDLINTGKAGVVDDHQEREMLRKAVKALNRGKRLSSQKRVDGKFDVWVVGD